MNILLSSTQLDWNLLHIFAVVARTGSLTKAAKALHTSQPTVGRKLATLEESLGVVLIQRHPTGIQLTQKGAEILTLCEAMQRHASQAVLQAKQGADLPEGLVRLSATESVGTLILPPILRMLQERWPKLQIALTLENQLSAVHQGDQDIAIRMTQPTHAELVAKKIGEIPTALFASQGYLERYGVPESPEDLVTHRFIGFDQSAFFEKFFSSTFPHLSAKQIVLRTDSMTAQLQAARAGIGIVGLQTAVAKSFTQLQQVCHDLCLPPLSMWLVCHPDIRHASHVSAVFEHLESHLTEHVGGSSKS